MEIELTKSRLRAWRATDVASLAKHANNRAIWLNLRDTFPHPYTVADSQDRIERVHDLDTVLAIEVEGEAAGDVSLHIGQGVARRSGEIGYWLGETSWGRGIMTEVVQAVTDYWFQRFSIVRLFALVFEWNPASMRVLEKAGYRLEGRHHRAVLKDGRIIDALTFAKVSQQEGKPN